MSAGLSVEVLLPSSLTYSTRWRWDISVTPQMLHHQRKGLLYTFHIRLHTVMKRKRPCPPGIHRFELLLHVIHILVQLTNANILIWKTLCSLGNFLQICFKMSLTSSKPVVRNLWPNFINKQEKKLQCLHWKGTKLPTGEKH